NGGKDVGRHRFLADKSGGSLAVDGAIQRGGAEVEGVRSAWAERDRRIKQHRFIAGNAVVRAIEGRPARAGIYGPLPADKRAENGESMVGDIVVHIRDVRAAAAVEDRVTPIPRRDPCPSAVSIAFDCTVVLRAS